MNKKLIKRHAIRLYKRLRLPKLVAAYNNVRFLYRKPYVNLLDTIPVAGHGLFIRGWVFDPAGNIASIRFSAQDGSNIDLTSDILWSTDDKLSRRFGMYKFRLRPRFIALIELPAIGRCVPAGAQIVFELKSGTRRRMAIAQKSRHSSPLAEVEELLRTVPGQAADKRESYNKVYGPAVRAIWRTRDRQPKAAETVDYNPELGSATPRATLVVPIYGRYDFIEYQVAVLVNDESMRQYQVLYVIDDPRLSAEVKGSVEVLAKLYKMAFSVLYLPENLGFAGANNEAVKHAKSDLLLLLNSDVMPASKGWLDKLIDSTGESINNSITSVRLLYEDNSIQHNGMKFLQSPFVNELWTNIHPAKGFPANLVASNDSLVEVEAVSGACMLVSKSNFERLGGFDENYILGDYEDSDLCMKARQQGLKIQLNDNISLYHLERLSQSLVSGHDWKRELTYYNCWYHTTKWDEEIRSMQYQVRSANG